MQVAERIVLIVGAFEQPRDPQRKQCGGEEAEVERCVEENGTRCGRERHDQGDCTQRKRGDGGKQQGLDFPADRAPRNRCSPGRAGRSGPSRQTSPAARPTPRISATVPAMRPTLVWSCAFFVLLASESPSAVCVESELRCGAFVRELSGLGEVEPPGASSIVDAHNCRDLNWRGALLRR